jgi:nicotinate (nicotinamide) nucleotide adenylyltransferase
MCHLAFEGVEISKLEHDQSYQGTLHMLKKIEEEKNDEVGFIIGADQLETFTSWINYKTLIQEHKCLIVSREGTSLNTYSSLLKQFKKYTIIDLDYPMSSTQIRNNMFKHIEDINPKVYAYIKMHSLYKE